MWYLAACMCACMFVHLTCMNVGQQLKKKLNVHSLRGGPLDTQHDHFLYRTHGDSITGTLYSRGTMIKDVREWLHSLSLDLKHAVSELPQTLYTTHYCNILYTTQYSNILYTTQYCNILYTTQYCNIVQQNLSVATIQGIK